MDLVYIIYLDNILIYSPDEASYERHVSIVLEALERASLFINLEKYTFYTKSVGFLGFIITPEGVIIDPKRVIIIAE